MKSVENYKVKWHQFYSCANQHLVSKEVYSDKPMKKKPIPHTYKIIQKLRDNI